MGSGRDTVNILAILIEHLPWSFSGSSDTMLGNAKLLTQSFFSSPSILSPDLYCSIPLIRARTKLTRHELSHIK